MGKIRSYEIIEYRNIIMNAIISSPNLIKLLDESRSKHPEDSIPFSKVFPHEYIPDTITETERFINFDISCAIDYRNNVYKDMIIYFFVVCHQSVVRYIEKGVEYVWYDRVVCELDNIFGGKNVLGVGKTMISSNAPYYPQNKFKGRLVQFTVKDFTNGFAYGR